MIDTIVLTLNRSDYTIIDPEKFTPSAHWALSSTLTNRILQSKQNPTKKELQQGIYKPKLTLSNRNQIFALTPTLRIELSLPKLFFGNNFAELQLKDFVPLTQKLVTVLKEMGIETTVRALEQASVLVIHYAKNIVLTDGSTPYHYIQKIKEANIALSLDTNQTDYRNEGHSYKWHTNSYEVVFYDKIKDLEKAKVSKKRALEKDNMLQIKLFDALRKRKKKFEVLRMEVRLNTRKKMKQLFKKLEVKTELTFKQLFKPALAKKILLYYLDEIDHKRPLLLDYKASDTALLADLIINNPTMKSKQIFQFYGLKKSLDAVGARGLRAMLATHDKRSWYRLMADAAKVVLPISYDPIKDLRDKLKRFKMVQLNRQFFD